jgi:hydroxymethylbilane synthase
MSAKRVIAQQFGGHRPPLQKIVLGTRGSELARAQAAQVENALRAAAPQVEFTTAVVRTSGDERSGAATAPPDPRAGRKGLFTREIERALLEHEIDIAVHSAKDIPSEMTAGLEIAAVLPRANTDDLLIAKAAGDVLSLRPGAVIATGSVRRQRQLVLANPKIRLVELRGNVPTRLQKLATSDWHGVVLARAGIERLRLAIDDMTLKFEGSSFHVQRLPAAEFVPAGGQGVIAMQVRSAAADTKQLLALVNHPPTHACLSAEREFLRRLQGDCQSPVGVFAQIDENGEMTIRAQVFDAIGTAPRTGKLGPISIREKSPELIGRLLFQFIDAQRK